MKRSRIFFLFLTGLYPLMAGLRLAAQPLATSSVPAVLTNAAQIHLLSFSEAQGRIPVFLRAVITCYDPATSVLLSMMAPRASAWISKAKPTIGKRAN
jgi:hypothetical protein